MFNTSVPFWWHSSNVPPSLICSALSPVTPGSAVAEEKFLVIEPYRASMLDEISLEKGVVVDVLERNLDGWWLVK